MRTQFFTTEAARKGGWARATTWAEWRRQNPSDAERKAREILTGLGVAFEVEYRIEHANGQPQWLDIFIPALSLAIEVDGSHGWHNWNGGGSKMDALDEIKTRWCEDHNIRLVQVKQRDLTAERFSEILGNARIEEAAAFFA